MKLLYLIFLALIKITGAMPLQVSSFLLTRLGRIAYYLDIKHRNIAIENLKVAFGNEKSQEEIELIARKVFENLPLTFLDFCRIPKITKDNLSKFVTFENIESDLLLKAKKNVNVATLFRKFLGELYRRLIRNFGFLDGEIGIIESIYQAFSKTITYLFLYEKRFRKKESSSLRSLP